MPWRIAALAMLSLVILNTLLTFENALPGVGVKWSPRLSFDLCALVAALMAWVTWRGVPSRRTASWWSAGFLVLVAARYADVTVPAVFGRPVNVYWDGRHGMDAARLAASAFPAWQVAGWAIAALLGAAALHRTVRWAIAGVSAGLSLIVRSASSAASSRAALLLTLGALGASFASYAAYEPRVRDTRWFFALPVAPTLWRQALLVRGILASDGTNVLPESPAFGGRVTALKGADVLVVFAESYGMTAFEDPAKAVALAPSFSRFADTIAVSGRDVVSARVRSPTYAGGSWLAHAALLTGIDTHEPGTYDVLLASHRPSLVTLFQANGYRTVGWMPGLQKPWPEGAFYGYDRIAGVNALGYAGLEFGYWRIPDQAAVALLGEQELAPVPAPSAPASAPARSAGSTGSADAPVGRRPARFVVFPTLATHVPFRPIAPYVDDWSRVTRADGYSARDLHDALAAPVSWEHAQAAYVESLQYQFRWLGGWLAQRAPRHLTVIVVGDHQPLAAVSGADATWDVPVHVVSDDADLLADLERHGFTPGLVPPNRTLGRMSDLTRVLLAVFAGPPAPGG